MTEDTPNNDDEGNGSPPTGGLDRPIQDLLGQQLRAALNETTEKPAYLGDPALPVEFEHQLVRLESTIEVREKGVEAVRDALEKLDLDLDLDADPPTDS